MNFKILFSFLLLAIFSGTVSAQRQPIEVNQFYFSQSVLDPISESIKVKRNADSHYSVNIQIIRPNATAWTSPNVKYNVEVDAFVKKNNSNTLLSIRTSEIKFTASDFASGTFVSALKTSQLLIPKNYIDESGGEIIVKWRYYKENYPSPYNQNGWSDWYTVDGNYPLKLEAIPGTIAGPNQICDQGTYTITNYGDVTLRNAANIATVNRIQGTSQFTVSRIGNGSGKIQLVTKPWGDAAETVKEIIVGTPLPRFKGDYAPQLDYGQTYTFVIESDLPSDILDIEKLGMANIVFTRLDNNRFTIKTPPKPSSGTPVAPVYIFSIKARTINGVCGNSEYITKNFRVGSLN
ncbi:hypothetical protein [Sphingobacterium chungjuense]|uniref:hypothetical protein n=1 Tax=Sphingobacterium chungjuense TaxID=2675553 RepID=UPI00140A86D1|nr:hypothetical protein [Sphingobacterium chungjuense]